MIRTSLIRILAILVLVSTLLSPVQAGAWYCEGRACGMTPWRCCCVSSTGKDAKCGQPQSKTAGVSGCPADCNCVMVLTADKGPLSAAVPVFVAPFVATLPLAPVLYIAPAPSLPLLCGMETRGPPRAPIVFASLSLRAPPIA